VPGTTTILGVINKPALMYWAWDLGMQGIDYRKYTDEMASIGTLVHKRIEDHIKGVETDFADYRPTQIKISDVGYHKFLEWEQENNPQYLRSELMLSSAKYGYGGTVDLYARIGEKYVLIDFKTSKAIYDDQFCQVSAYAQLLRENGMLCDEVMILRIGRDESEGFEVRKVNQEELYFEVFKNALSIYNNKKKLKWR
jgi:hypothetical protein